MKRPAMLDSLCPASRKAIAQQFRVPLVTADVRPDGASAEFLQSLSSIHSKHNMDWSVSSRFSSFSPLPNATCQPGEAFRTAATSIPACPAQAQHAPHAMDVVIFWGPGQRREDLLTITNAASDAGLHYRIVEILDDGFLSGSVKMDLYCNDELGPYTQVIACFAVQRDLAAHTHYLSLSEDGLCRLPAADFISWVRTPPGEPGFPLRAPWQGTMHAFWQLSGNLRDDYQGQRLSGLSGPMISYACRKGGSVHNAVTAMQDLCAYVGTVRGKAPYLEPEYIAARMLGIAGDTVACWGGRFKRALVVGAPRTPLQAQHDYLIDGLQGRHGRPARMLGADEDRQAVADAMRHPLVRGAASKRQRSKLENAFMVRAERYKLAAMEEFCAAHPSLAAMTEHTGRSGLQVYRRVAGTMAVERERALLSTGQGNAENLRCLLDNVAMLRRHGETFRLNLASLVHGRADFQAIALKWAVEQDDSDLLLYLLQTATPPERPDLTRHCYRLALQTSRSLAIGLLSQAHSQASVAQLIAYGINDGASQKVVCAWLSEIDWITSRDSAEAVLEALARHKLFGILALQARDFPGRFQQLIRVMYENQDLYASYAEALLEYALETRNALLYRQLEQDYFQVGRINAAHSVRPAKAISLD